MRDMEGISAATTPSAAAKDAGGTGEPTGSNAPGPPDPDPASLLDIQPDNVFGSPNANSALPARKTHPPAQIFFLRSAEPTEPLDPEIEAAREAARAERRNPTRQPDRSDGSIRERKS
jgi:hypothetical protein